MSPLMPAVRLTEAATLPLPHSQEMRAPASATFPCCFSSKMAWMTRTKSCGARPPVRAARSSSRRFVHLGVERRVRVVLPGRDERLLDPPDPAVEDVAQGPARARRGAELGQDLAVHVVEPVEPEVVVGDDDEAGREPPGLRVEHGEAGHEGLAAAVAAAEELDGALAVSREVELPVQFPALLLDADGERVDVPAPARGPCAVPRRRARRPSGSVCSSASLPHVSLHPGHDVDAHGEGGLLGIGPRTGGRSGAGCAGRPASRRPRSP